MKDGWHTIKGFKCYIENGEVKRGIKEDSWGNEVTAYPYFYSTKHRCWINAVGVKASTFRAGSYELR